MLRWQLIATAALTLVAMLVWGEHGAYSAFLGGAVNIVAGAAYGWRVSRREASTAGEALGTMFRAEGIKVLLILAGVMLVMTYYKDVVHAAFFATFVITVGVFAAAIAVRDTEEKNASRDGPGS